MGFLESQLGKAALGFGLGGLGGALSDDPASLFSFIGEEGQTGLSGPESKISIDPQDLTAQGLARSQVLQDALAGRLREGTQIGPAALVQNPGFAFGGALPAALGFTGNDPGFQQRSFDPFGGREFGFVTSADGRPGFLGDFDDEEFGPGNDDSESGQAALATKRGSGPTSRTGGRGGEIDPSSSFTDMARPSRFGVPALGSGLPVTPPGGGGGELDDFITAINALRVQRGREPVALNGLRS